MPRVSKTAPPASVVIKKPIRHKGRREFIIPDHTWQKVLAEYANGWSIEELAIRLGCNYKTLQARFKKRGVTKPPKKRVNHDKTRYNNLVRRPIQQELLTQAKLNAKEAELMMLSPSDDYDILDSLLETEDF